jgi:serpin B
MKTLNVIILLFTLFIVFIGCDTDPINIIEDAKPIVLKVELQKRINQDNAFAIDLLKQTMDASKEANVTVSPLSVSIALGMTWNGADGTTKSEMETTLKMSGLTVNQINEYYKVMLTELPVIDPTTKLSIANSIWYKKDFSVKSDFLAINKENFNAYVKEIDFLQTWAKDTINNWCSVKTNGLIPTIIDDIPSNAMMYLVNAVYFKGIWSQKFDKKNTTESTFTNEAGNSVKVNMMHQQDTLGYTSDEMAQFVDLRYGNKAFSMTIIVPEYSKTVNDILKNLTVEKWNEIIANLQQREIILNLPRFKSENKFLLNEPLISMGMPTAFTANADFTKISDIRLMISRVLHKTYIAVDEDGTEAAAVTAVEMRETSMPIIPEVRVDRPFIFAIREKSTGVILFIGKMGNVEKF